MITANAHRAPEYLAVMAPALKLERTARPRLPDLGFADAARLSWQDWASCAETDPDAWFPEKGQTNTAAKRVCESCPVRLECLEYALENGEEFGVWGGLSEQERCGLKPGAALAADVIADDDERRRLTLLRALRKNQRRLAAERARRLAKAEGLAA